MLIAFGGVEFVRFIALRVMVEKILCDWDIIPQAFCADFVELEIWACLMVLILDYLINFVENLVFVFYFL